MLINKVSIEIGQPPRHNENCPLTSAQNAQTNLKRQKRREVCISRECCVHWGALYNAGLFLLLVYCGKDTLMTALRAECVLIAPGF